VKRPLSPLLSARVPQPRPSSALRRPRATVRQVSGFEPKTRALPPPSYLGRITPRRIMGDTTWSEMWKSQSVGSLLALNSSSNPPI
jgi:hypothetical protein